MNWNTCKHKSLQWTKHYVKVQELVMILLAGLIYQKTMTKKNSRALKKQQQKFNLTLRY